MDWQSSILELTRALVRVPSRAGVDSYDPIAQSVMEWLRQHHVAASYLREDDGRVIGLTARVAGPPGPTYLLADGESQGGAQDGAPVDPGVLVERSSSATSTGTRDVYQLDFSRRFVILYTRGVNYMCIGVIPLILLLVFGPSPVSGQTTEAKHDPKKADAAGKPSLSLPKADFKIEVGLEQKSFAVLVQGRNLSGDLMKGALSAADFPLPGKSKATVEVDVAHIVELTPGKDSRDWWVPVTVKSIERNTNEPRVLRVTLGSLTNDLDYTVSNQPTSDFKWTIQTPPNPWVVFGDPSPLSIPISTGPQAVTNIGVSHNLVEQTTRRMLPADALRLCSKGDGCPVVRAGANSVAHAYVVIRGDLPAGKYSGPVFFSTPEKAGPESITFNIHISSLCHYVAGIIVLIAGVWLGWIVSSFTTARVARLTALDLVVPVQTALVKLKNDWNPIGADGERIRGKLGSLAADLEERELDKHGLLPPQSPQIFPRNRSAALQTKLDEASKLLALANIVLERGSKTLMGEGATPHRATALKELEDLALSGDDKDALKRIGEILTKFQSAKTAASGAALRGDAQRPVPIPEDKIQRAFAELNQLGWLLWALFTVLGGFYLLILDKTGFGLIGDYIMCFFWGVGIPTAADKLSPAGVLQTLRAATPKT